MENILSFFENKKVALVGPSKSIIHSNQGIEIESFDYVARMNHQWPILSALNIDIGCRMDLLYHCCNPDFSMMRFSCPEFRDTRWVFYEQGIQTSVLKMICQEHKINSLDITSIYQNINNKLKMPPNTGIAAISHLLSLPIRSLKLFGLTFHQECYYEGYLGKGAEPKYWENGKALQKIWNHQIDKQFTYFLEHLLLDSRLSVDSLSRKIMRID